MTPRAPTLHPEDEFDDAPTPCKRHSSIHDLRENEGLTVAMRLEEQTRSQSSKKTATQPSYSADYNIGDATFDDTEYNPDGPDFTSADVDDTGFSMFSEMPGIDMTKFAALRQSPTKNGLLDQVSLSSLRCRQN